MTNVILSDAPSALYRKQIRNIAARMWRLTTETALNPLRDMTAFNKVHKDFNKAENEAYLCCSVMDNASIDNEDRANGATTAVMAEMVHLRNDASDLIESEPNETLQKRLNNGSSEMREALAAIYRTYSATIRGDVTLDKDFQRLIECVAVSKSSAAKRCEKIINHVLAEVRESAGDDQRMADESPSCGSDDSESCRHLQTHLELRKALENFYTKYLKH